MAEPTDRPSTTRIVQGHPTGFEPDANKGGQNGAPKPDGRSATPPAPPPTRSEDLGPADKAPGSSVD